MARCVVTSFKFDRNGNSRISVNAGHIKRRPEYDQGKCTEENHKGAVESLAKEMGWDHRAFKFISAYMPGDESKMVHVIFTDFDVVTL